MAQKKCADCGGPVPPVINGRPRKYCPDCSPSQRRGKPKFATVVNDTPVESGRVLDAITATLEEADRLGHPLGAVALTLAEQIDAGGHAATGYAALAKQLESTLDAALKGAKVHMSAVDELRARRERRRA